MMIPWENTAILLRADVLIALLNMALLGGIGGFLIFLHVRMRNLKRDLQALPRLSGILNKNIMKAQEDLQALKKSLQEIEPTAGTLIKDGQNIAQDLDFFIHRAQKTVQKLEKMDAQMKAMQAEGADAPQAALEAEMKKGVQKGTKQREQQGMKQKEGRYSAPDAAAPPALPFEERLEREPDVSVAELSPTAQPEELLAEGVGVSPAEEKLRARLGLGGRSKLGAPRG